MQETPTLLPVARWGARLGMHPLHLQQVDLASTQTTTPMCGQPVLQHAWQDRGQRTSREDIATAIATAEEQIASVLGYSVLPDWTSEDVRLVDQDWRPEIYPWHGSAVTGKPATVELRNGYFIGGGQRAVSVISAGAAVVYTDEDGDGYKETATAAVATSVTDLNQIAVFYRSADTPLGTAADPEWEVRPITVGITAGTATIRWRRELGVIANLLTELEPEAVDGAIDANFITAVDVYRRYTDPATSARYEWEGGGCGCVCGSASCGYTVGTGCLLAHDERNSIASIQPATYDAATAAWTMASWAYCRRPDRAVTWYRAGYRDMRRPRPYYDMDPMLERCVAYMATALLERPVCGCDSVASQMAMWRQDLAMTPVGDVGGGSFQISQGDLANPFGTRYGQVWAWRVLSNSRDRVLGRRAAG